MFKIIKSSSNSYINQIIKLRKEKKFRLQKKKVLIVEKNTINDLIKTQNLDTLIVTKKELIETYPQAKNVLVVTDKIMKKITNVQSPQEIAAVFDYSPIEIKNTNYVLILDNISDPGNLGTIIRSALALNFDLIILTKNCTDPFNDKALRSAKGSTFHIPMLTLDEKEILNFITQKKINAYLADIDGENIKNVALKKPLALILSSESEGPSLFFKKIAKKITIPINKNIDSLNVAIAAGICMYMLRKA
ncbi:MAG: hypothetical protein ACD_20C00031G0002 [uncultured bacterium]|nr:MAG: hypothetical protein ACD_20C00031G0002 [uncultured bacterium]